MLEHSYRVILDSFPIGMFQADVQGNWYYVNKRLCELTGVSPDVVLGQKWTQTIHNDDLTHVTSEWSNLINNRKPIRLEFRILKPDSTSIWVLFKVVHVTIAEGISMFVGTVQDISSRKQTENSLVENEQRYRMLAENATDVIWTSSLDCQITYISPSVTKLLGYTQEEAKRIGAELNVITAERKPFAYLEVTMVHKDGHKVIVESSGVPVKDEHDNLLGCRGMAHDITKRKREEDIDYLLEEIPKAVSESLASIERITKIVRAMKEFSHPGSTKKTATINKAIADVVGDGSNGKGLITISTKAEKDFAEIRISDTGSGIPESARA